MFSLDDDFVAPKFENMFFESFRGFGDAGDSGMLRNGAFGDANSGILGDRGLCGLIGALMLSFPPDFDRMASDNVDDFGILRTCLRGWLCCYCPLSVTLQRLSYGPVVCVLWAKYLSERALLQDDLELRAGWCAFEGAERRRRVGYGRS